jgi:hypothetical protein
VVFYFYRVLRSSNLANKISKMLELLLGEVGGVLPRAPLEQYGVIQIEVFIIYIKGLVYIKNVVHKKLLLRASPRVSNFSS